MPSEDQIAQQRELLEVYRRTLADYFIQQAKIGTAYAPPAIAHGIREARDGIRHVKGILREWGVTVEDHPDDGDMPPVAEVTSRVRPSPPKPATPVIALPPLIGRDDILASALQQLRSEKPVVLLHGPVGSGRDSIAQFLVADLQRRGHMIWRYPPIEEKTVEQFTAACGAYLAYRHQHEESTDMAAAASVSGWTRAEDLHLARLRLHEALEHSEQPVALLVRLSIARAELRSFLIQLAMEVTRTKIVFIADASISELHRGITLAVPPLSAEQVRAYIQRKYLPLSESAALRLHSASHGLPAILDLLIKEAKQQQTLSVSLSHAVLNVEPTASITSFLRDRIQELNESLCHLLELDGLLHHHTPEVLEDEVGIDQLRQAIIQYAGWNGTNSPDGRGATDALRKEYRQVIDEHYRDVRALLYPLAFEQLLPSDRHQLCEWIAEFYSSKDAPESTESAYRAAYYQVQAGQWNNVVGFLLSLANTPEDVFTERCQQFYEWAKQALIAMPAAKPQALLTLAGDCAAYLGQYKQAIVYYNEIKIVLSDASPTYPHMLARLLRAYEALGDTAHAKKICQELVNYSGAPISLQALGIAYKGAAGMFEDSAESAATITEAIEHIGQPHEVWGREEHEIWVRLHDALARAEAQQGHAKKAISLLLSIYPLTQNMPALQARIDNNLAYIYYYVCGQPDDIEQARQLFRRALKLRVAIGDQVGIMRTAQNIANLHTDLARNSAEWAEAEDAFKKAEEAAKQVDSADRYLIIANHMDALIHRGDFVGAENAFIKVTLSDVNDDLSVVMLLLNRAKLALWSEDLQDCQQYLEEALSPIADADEAINKLEWSQIAIECHIRLGAPLNRTAIEWLDAIPYPEGDQRDSAEWYLAQGLLARAREDLPRARKHFDESYRIFSEALGYCYRATISQLWQADCAARAGDVAQARMLLAQADHALDSFGETPIRQRLYHLGEQIDTQEH